MNVQAEAEDDGSPGGYFSNFGKIKGMFGQAIDIMTRPEEK